MNRLILLWYRLTFWVICCLLPRLMGKTRFKYEVKMAMLPAKPGWVIPIWYKVHWKK